jgi:hypothetical protein
MLVAVRQPEKAKSARRPTPCRAESGAGAAMKASGFAAIWQQDIHGPAAAQPAICIFFPSISIYCKIFRRRKDSPLAGTEKRSIAFIGM